MSALRARASKRAARALAACTALAGCRVEGEPPDIIVVALSADATVSERLVRVEARLRPAGSAADSPPLRSQLFALRDGDRAAPRTTLPFSFSITRADADVFELELVGFDSIAPNTAPVIARRTVARFGAEKFTSLPMVFVAACLDRRCPDGTTCAPFPLEGARAGECVPISESRPSPVIPGRETFVVSFDAPFGAAAPAVDASVDAGVAEAGRAADAGAAHEPEATVEASGDSGRDAGPGPGSEHDADAASLPPEVLPECPASAVCPSAAYPCLPSDDGAGFVCRGQYAAWPMPDSEVGAKVAPRYTARPADGTVLDEITGLLWQREPPATYPGCTGNLLAAGDGCSWDEAVHYCSQLQLGGARFRLPTKIELESLLEFRAGYDRPLIDSAAFPNAVAAEHWSSTESATAGPVDEWFDVSFRTGLPSLTPKMAFQRVRCVRSERVPNAPPSARYRVQGATVVDTFTGLEWQQSASAAPLSAAAAAQYCRDVEMRVPTFKELLTLMDVTRTTVAIDPLFDPEGDLVPHVTRLLWSTTPAPDGGTMVYTWSLGLAFSDLAARSSGGPYTLHARCVR